MIPQEALRHFEEQVCKHCCEWDKSLRHCNTCPTDTAKKALEKQATSEWIPVSERLPDNNGTYLITVSSYDETASIEYIAVDHGNTDGGFLHFETKKNPKAKSGKVVTAWMPAPKPYREGEQDD